MQAKLQSSARAARGFLGEFREFAMRGNMLDLAVGIIIGGGFSGLVQSLVNDLIMPPLGLIIGGVDFGDLKLVLRAATESAPAVTWNYGSFAQAVLHFVIVAFAVFLLVKAVNKLRRTEEQRAAKEPPRQEALLAEIRDLLAKRN